MSLKANGQPEVAEKKQPTVGTLGNYIEPIEGEQLSPEELTAQYMNDFGDNIEDFLDDVGIVENEVSIRPQQAQKEEHDIITPDGRPLVRKDPELEDLESDAYSKEFADEVEERQVVKPKEKVASTEQVDLSDYVPKSEYDETVRKYNTLQGEFNDLKKTVNAGLSNVTDEELRVLRKIKYDYENTPLGLVVTKYYQGGLDLNAVGKFNKAPQDYMPDGEVFDQSDAFTPGTTSFVARERWEDEKLATKSQYAQAAKYIEEISKKEEPDQKELDAQMEQRNKELLDELVKKVPVAAKYQDAFINWMQKQHNLFMIAWPVFASQVSTAMKKRGTQPPKEHLAGKGGGGYSSDDVDSEINDIFGD